MSKIDQIRAEFPNYAPAFEEWAKATGLDLTLEDDWWHPWWDCFLAGVRAGES